MEMMDENLLQIVPIVERDDIDNEACENDGDGSEDEEQGERDAYELEREIVAFRDEPQVKHNVYPETDEDDSEGENDEEDKKGEECEEGEEDEANGDRQRNRDYTPPAVGVLEENMIFFNRVAFVDAVVKYVCRTGRNLQQYRYDRTKIAYKCAGGNECSWRIYCSRVGRTDEWKVRIFNKVHSCSLSGRCVMMKVPVIARLFLDKIRDEPDYYMPMKMEAYMFEKWKIKASRHQCQAARKKALRWMEKEYDTQFERLRDYGAEILASNPNSTVAIETVKNTAGQDVFSRFYVCFAQLKTTWKETCRPLIGVDGCFLKGKMKGEVLVALGRDGNNQIYPIAWGCVQVENMENWVWFIQKIKEDLDLEDGDGVIIMSDRQKGLVRAVEDELPLAEHRMCVRHIYANIKKRQGKKPYVKPLVWNLAWSYSETEFDANLAKILEYDAAVYNEVMRQQPRTWSRAFYRLGNYCEDVENNSVESFNASIVKARAKPFVHMLETIRRLTLVRIAKRSVFSNDHKGICTPYVEEFLATEHEVAVECTVIRSTNGLYEVVRSGTSYRVNLDRRMCSCRKFDLCGIPCGHAYAAIISKKLEPEEFVCHWFRTSTWRMTYENGLAPLRGPAFWPSTNGPNIYQPPPRSMPGRKKGSTQEKRKKGVNESPTKKKNNNKRTMHCKICGQPNHNKRFHKVSQGESSQPTLTQGDASQRNEGQLTQLTLQDED